MLKKTSENISSGFVFAPLQVITNIDANGDLMTPCVAKKVFDKYKEAIDKKNFGELMHPDQPILITSRQLVKHIENVIKYEKVSKSSKGTI